MGKAMVIKLLLTLLIFAGLTLWVLFRLQNFGSDDDLMIHTEPAAVERQQASGPPQQQPRP